MTAPQTPIKGETRGRGRKAVAMLLRYGVPIVITVGLCHVLLRGLDVRMMWQTVCRECDFTWIGINALLLITAMVARALRWRIQLKALGIKAGVWPLTLSVFGTYAVNLVFPRLGEVWRTGYVAQRYRAPFGTVFGSMVADRLTDTIAVGLISLLALLMAGPQVMSFLGQSAGVGAFVAGVLKSPLVWVVVCTLIFIIMVLFKRYRRHRIVVAVVNVWHELWHGFAVIAAMPGKGLWLIYTLIIWLSYFVGLGCAFMAFPLTAQVLATHGLTALLVCFVLTSLSMLVPSNGGIGPWQWAMVWGLGLYKAGVAGLDHAYMVTFANLALGVQTVMSIVLGLLTFTYIALNRNRQ